MLHQPTGEIPDSRQKRLTSLKRVVIVPSFLNKSKNNNPSFRMLRCQRALHHSCLALNDTVESVKRKEPLTTRANLNNETALENNEMSMRHDALLG